uniref:Peroxin/Ferlin domain-containing protein n=1 Tax=Spongospora subterranea TaxID=70186 RepID=A0A0H5R8F5_9EUKA|eukprot:CRZ09992.1 hypothetical protein [Spongospora subterranea]
MLVVIALICALFVFAIWSPRLVGSGITTFLRLAIPSSICRLRIGQAAFLSLQEINIEFGSKFNIYINSVSFHILSLSIVISKIQITYNIWGLSPRFDQLSAPPAAFRVVNPYITLFLTQLLAYIQICVNQILFQVVADQEQDGKRTVASAVVSEVCICSGRSLSVRVAYVFSKAVALEAFNIKVVCRYHVPFSLLSLSGSIANFKLRSSHRVVVHVAESGFRYDCNDAALQASVHVATVSTDQQPALFLGHLSLMASSTTVSVSVFSLRLHVTERIPQIISLCLSYSRYLTPNPAPAQVPELQLYATNVEISLVSRSIACLCIDEAALRFGNNPSTDFVSLVSLAVLTGEKNLVLVNCLDTVFEEGCVKLTLGNIEITVILGFAQHLLPITKLGLSFGAIFTHGGTPTPRNTVTLRLSTGNVHVNVNEFFSCNVSSSALEASPGTCWALSLEQSHCFYDDEVPFLTVRHFKLTGAQAKADMPHKTLHVTGSCVRGTWSPGMQLSLLLFIKQVIASVINCKYELFPLIFDAQYQSPPKRPTMVPQGLPAAGSVLDDWAYRTRAPYLAESLQVVSLDVHDVIIIGQLTPFIDARIHIGLFYSEFMPFHIQLERVALTFLGFPMLNISALNSVRQSSIPTLSLMDIKRDPLLSETGAMTLLAAPNRVDIVDVSIRIPGLESDFHRRFNQEQILVHARGFSTALLTLPTIDELVRRLGGPGYIEPPPLSTSSHSAKIQNLSVCIIDNQWDSWVHNVHPLGLDERVAAGSRRELLRLKIREHQRRTGKLLADSRISLMSTRLSETNFALFGARIGKLRSMHNKCWSFYDTEAAAGVQTPGDFRLGSLVRVSISMIEVTVCFGLNPISESLSARIIVDSTVRLDIRCLEVHLRQFSPAVIDMSAMTGGVNVVILHGTGGPSQQVQVELGPHHQATCSVPYYPMMALIDVSSCQISRACFTVAPCLSRTAVDILKALERFRPRLFDHNTHSLTLMDVGRYLIHLKSISNISLTELSCSFLNRMTFVTSTDTVSHHFLRLKVERCTFMYAAEKLSCSFDVESISLRLHDSENSNRTQIQVSSSSFEENLDNADIFSYDDNILIFIPLINASITLKCLTSDNVQCSDAWVYDSADSIEDCFNKDPFAAFRCDRVPIAISLSCGRDSMETRIMLNKHNLPFLLTFMNRFKNELPPVSSPDASSLDLTCTKLSFSNLSFTLLDAENNNDPGQGLRVCLASLYSEFIFRDAAVHNTIIRASLLSGCLVANDSFWRKSESGRRLFHDIRDGNIVVVHTYENQRFILGQGWLSRLLPTDRPNWSDADGTQELPKTCSAFDLPSAEHWQWESDWVVDRGQLHALGTVDPEGWEYAHDFPRCYSAKRHWTDNVRRRRWFRIRRLIESIRMENAGTVPRKQNGLLFLVESCQAWQKPSTSWGFRSASKLPSAMQSPATEPAAYVTSLLTFFSIDDNTTSAASPPVRPTLSQTARRFSTVSDMGSSLYLFSVKVSSPKARLTLESRNSLALLWRSYMQILESNAKIRPLVSQVEPIEVQSELDDAVSSGDENSDEDETAVTSEDRLLSSLKEPDEENISPITENNPVIPISPDSLSINPVSLLDIASIEVTCAQFALESCDESARGILLMCMSSCLITARSFCDGDQEAPPTVNAARIDLRLLIDHLTVRLAPTDIDVDAGVMWFDFQKEDHCVIKPIIDPFPVQASAVVYPSSTSAHSVCILVPGIITSLDSSQCALLGSIIGQVVTSELPPVSPSPPSFVLTPNFADGRISDHQRILWQIRHLEWLMGVFHDANDLLDSGVEMTSSDNELVLLAAHMAALRQQYTDTISSLPIVKSSLPGFLSEVSLNVQVRLENVTLSLLLMNRVEFVRLTLLTCAALLQVQLTGEGSFQLSFEIRDLRIHDGRNLSEEWNTIVIPAHHFSASGVVSDDTQRHAENRVVLTLQTVVKRVGGICVICSCILNMAHLVVRLTQTLTDQLANFISDMGVTDSDLIVKSRLVPRASGVLGTHDQQMPASTSSKAGNSTSFDEVISVQDRASTAETAVCSPNSIVITYLRIGAIRLTVSFKGSGASGLADFQGLSIRMPPVLYQKKTWTTAKFARRLRRDFIRSALRQAGPGLAGFLRYKFGGSTADANGFLQRRTRRNDDLTALDIDLPIGSSPIQPSPHPMTKGRAVVSGLMTKIKAVASGDNQSAADGNDLTELADPLKRRLLVGANPNKPGGHDGSKPEQTGRP